MKGCAGGHINPDGICKVFQSWQGYGNHSLSPALITITSTHRVEAARQNVYKSLVGIFVCQLSVWETNLLPPLLPVNGSRTVAVPANLCCHPHSIVIHVFIRLCTKKGYKGGWVVVGGCRDREC